MAGPQAGPTQTVSKPFRQPFRTVSKLSAQTGQLTKSIDPAIEKTLDFVYHGYEVTKGKVEKLPKVNSYLLLALGVFLSGAISIALIIPALIFFPVTILVGIATSFTVIALAPLATILGWILISSPPVQEKVVKPALELALENKKVAKILLED